MVERKGFNFYRSYWEQIKLLNEKQKVQILEAICKVQFLEVNINDISFTDKMAALVWVGVKHSVSTSLNGFISKNKGLNKEVIPPLTKGGTQQLQVKEQVQVKEEVQLVSPYRSFAHLKISNEENEKLLNLGYSKYQIDFVLDKIENYKKNTSYKSLYLTAKAWLKKENTNQPTSKIGKTQEACKKAHEIIMNTEIDLS